MFSGRSCADPSDGELAVRAQLFRRVEARVAERFGHAASRPGASTYGQLCTHARRGRGAPTMRQRLDVRFRACAGAAVRARCSTVGSGVGCQPLERLICTPCTPAVRAGTRAPVGPISSLINSTPAGMTASAMQQAHPTFRGTRSRIEPSPPCYRLKALSTCSRLSSFPHGTLLNRAARLTACYPFCMPLRQGPGHQLRAWLQRAPSLHLAVGSSPLPQFHVNCGEGGDSDKGITLPAVHAGRQKTSPSRRRNITLGKGGAVHFT